MESVFGLGFVVLTAILLYLTTPIYTLLTLIGFNRLLACFFWILNLEFFSFLIILVMVGALAVYFLVTLMTYFTNILSAALPLWRSLYVNWYVVYFWGLITAMGGLMRGVVVGPIGEAMGMLLINNYYNGRLVGRNSFITSFSILPEVLAVEFYNGFGVALVGVRIMVLIGIRFGISALFLTKGQIVK